MTRSWIFVGSLIAALAAPLTARAQQNTSNTRDPKETSDAEDGPEGSKYEFLISGTGATSRSTGNGNLDNDVLSGSAYIGYYLNPVVEFSLRQSGDWLKTKRTGSNTVAGTRVAMDLHWPLGRFRPFVGANYGLFYGDGIRTNSTNVFAPEGGIKIYLRPQTFVMLMTEYQVVFDRIDDFDNNWKDAGFTYTLGMGFNW